MGNLDAALDEDAEPIPEPEPEAKPKSSKPNAELEEFVDAYCVVIANLLMKSLLPYGGVPASFHFDIDSDEDASNLTDFLTIKFAF